MNPPSDGEFFPSIFLLVILVGIGSKLVTDEPGLRLIGFRVAIVVFLAWLFIGWSDTRPSSAGEWLQITVGSLFIAGYALGICWIALPVVAFFYRRLILPPIEGMGRLRERARRERQRRRSERDAERARKRAQIEFERSAPERERQRLLTEAAAKSQTDAQRRRQDARSSALLSYSYYAAKLGPRFPREMFDEYASQYMSDSFPPEVVEQRGKELLSVFQIHLAAIEPPKCNASFEAITEWHQTEIARLDALPVDPALKSFCRVRLRYRLQDMLKDYLEGAAP